MKKIRVDYIQANGTRIFMETEFTSKKALKQELEIINGEGNFKINGMQMMNENEWNGEKFETISAYAYGIKAYDSILNNPITK